jgi:hypothetical protein
MNGTDTERALRGEVDRLQWELDDRQRAEERRLVETAAAQRAREEAYRAEWNASYRTARSWPEALSKQANLLANEIGLDDPADGEAGTCFTDGSAACRRATVIWSEEEDRRMPALEALRAQIDALMDEVRTATAARLAAESDRQGWKQVASALEQNVNLNQWLDW